MSLITWDPSKYLQTVIFPHQQTVIEWFYLFKFDTWMEQSLWSALQRCPHDRDRVCNVWGVLSVQPKELSIIERCLLHIESIPRGLTVLCLLYLCRKPSIMGLGEQWMLEIVVTLCTSKLYPDSEMVVFNPQGWSCSLLSELSPGMVTSASARYSCICVFFSWEHDPPRSA